MFWLPKYKNRFFGLFYKFESKLVVCRLFSPFVCKNEMFFRKVFFWTINLYFCRRKKAKIVSF
jgi:hypothetical protein